MPLHQIVFLMLLAASCGYAIVRGGAPERVAASAMIAAVVATNIFSILWRPTAGAYASLEIGVALTDLSLFFVITGLALGSTRFWPMPLASMIGCGLFGHIAEPIAPGILPKAYYAIVAIWSYPSLFLLALATWRHRKRLARYGIDPAWVRHLPGDYRQGRPVDELPQAARS